MQESREFDRVDIRRLLERLDEKLADSGQYLEMYIAGGTALILRGIERRTTSDIDALLRTNNLDLLREIISQIAEEENVNPEWVNQHMKPWVPSNRDAGSAPLELDGFSEHLRVEVAPVEVLIAMKMESYRGRDMRDLQELCKQSGITDPHKLVEITQRMYGENDLQLTVSAQDLLLQAREVTEESTNKFVPPTAAPAAKYHYRSEHLSPKTPDNDCGPGL